jgi:HPt (histidine-containing phosphotransfer) domain-containing protein
VQENIIDLGALQRLLAVIGGDPEDFEELVEEFESSTPQTLEKMRAAAASADLGALRIASHSLKSNGRDFGATVLAEACEALEQDCRAGKVSDPQARVAEISVELDRARMALAEVTLPNG